LATDEPEAHSHTFIWRRTYDNFSLEAALSWYFGKQYKNNNMGSMKLLLTYTI
jgi:hypothetical protein